MRILLLAISIMCCLSLSGAAQTQTAKCQAIKKVPYPITQKRADQKMRIALLNLCPPNPGMLARPMFPTMVEGKIINREYEITRVFKSVESAKKYAKMHKITDISF